MGYLDLKEFQFDPERLEQVEAEFNGKKSIRFRYTVKEDGIETEQHFEASKRTSEEINTYLMEGVTKLKILRSGSGTDTYYLGRSV
ncbi:MAG TPA: hypothetical protein VE378_06850 [Nitrososphaeraceae archaeon]|nr:hypothetical protein [Nitrososphaeraceae archaeon]